MSHSDISITGDMVERGAIAAFNRDTMDGHHRGGPWTWESIPEQGRCNYRLTVRAALEAALQTERNAGLLDDPTHGVGCSCGADNIPGSVHAPNCDENGEA